MMQMQGTYILRGGTTQRASMLIPTSPRLGQRTHTYRHLGMSRVYGLTLM